MLGAANTPYARSVRPETLQPGALPDPGLIFDSIFARDTYKEHPNKVSSILYYWASLIIHGHYPINQCVRRLILADLFQTNHLDMNQSMTVSISIPAVERAHIVSRATLTCLLCTAIPRKISSGLGLTKTANSSLIVLWRSESWGCLPAQVSCCECSTRLC